MARQSPAVPPHRLCQWPLSAPWRKPCVHVEDRGLQLGEAVYEVCNVRHGRLIDEEPHLDRLERSLSRTRPWRCRWRAQRRSSWCCAKWLSKNRIADGLLYLQVSRGAAKRDHIPLADGPRPTLIITLRGQDIAALTARMEKGIAVAAAARRPLGAAAISRPPNCFPISWPRSQPPGRPAPSKAWLVDDDGFVTEGASTNAWIVDATAVKVVARDLESRNPARRDAGSIILEAAAAAGVAVG